MRKEIKKIKGWVAMNKDEFDISNMSFEKTKTDAIKHWGGRQVIIPVEIKFFIIN